MRRRKRPHLFGALRLPEKAEKCYLCARSELLPLCQAGHHAEGHAISGKAFIKQLKQKPSGRR